MQRQFTSFSCIYFVADVSVLNETSGRQLAGRQRTEHMYLWERAAVRENIREYYSEIDLDLEQENDSVDLDELTYEVNWLDARCNLYPVRVHHSLHWVLEMIILWSGYSILLVKYFIGTPTVIV